MGQRDLLFLIGALIIFALIVLTTNRIFWYQNESVMRREFESYSLALAESYIEEGRAKPFFDEALNGGSPQIPTGFTDPDALGPEGEVYPNFDDVDDFNGLATIDSTKRANFWVNIQVGYVEDTNPDSFVTYETLFKNMKVSVTDSNFVFLNFQLSYIFGYN